MALTFTDSDYDYYSVSVPLTDTRFAYIFELTTADGETLFYSEEGAAKTYDHSLNYFNFFQYASQFPCDLMRVQQWTRTAAAYQIFSERFAFGLTGKDKSYVNSKWGETPKPKSFFGCDLPGVREKLPYLEELGVNFLYLTPVFCSPSNHKYDITDYENVDPAFGGSEALRELIRDAHARGMRVMLDGVMNYGFTKALLDLLAFQIIDAEGFRDRLVRLCHARSVAASANMLNLLGSHDTDRFLTRVAGDARAALPSPRRTARYASRAAQRSRRSACVSIRQTNRRADWTPTVFRSWKMGGKCYETVFDFACDAGDAPVPARRLRRA